MARTLARALLHTMLPFIACSAFLSAAFADTYPSRPVRIVVPYPAGGGSDAMSRLAAEHLQVSLKQPIVVDNKPGAGSVIGSDFVAKSAPDGYTVLFNIPSLVQAPLLQKGVPFDPVRDLVPVTSFVSAPVWLAVSVSRSKATNVEGLRAEAQASGRGLEYGSWGNGTTNHLFGALLMKRMNMQGVHVPYKGSAPGTLALASGEIVFMLADYVSLRPHVETGRVRILASTGTRRHPLTPAVPTLSELGYAGFESVGWGGFFVPRGTPPPVVAQLEQAVATAARDPAVMVKMAGLGYEPGGKLQPEFASEVRQDAERWRRTFEEVGFQAE
ncbi:tripartite tricarboxylate transporter substrate binding protein [Variovorax sp. YR216]|uniref:Bug family tripartite tricarboxylate transporter substrate binding protein n=1 Tax=Variovorax sp. YR216 TaxID=1882828 RepID=UPI000895A554|nr:tripartite tricarboxylate transporter substrate binding protein [Variovorax sp. YR216]SEB19979.1 Tripartite-type tricarboxylate transporter, receptor component TctC [Variovorax sp. YR216]